MRIRSAIREIDRRHSMASIIGDLFPKQKEAVNIGNKVAILCSRRSGKSYLICSIMLHQCLTVPNSKCLYLALSFENAKGIALDTLSQLCKKYNVEPKINISSLEFIFNNGSKIKMAGAKGTQTENDRYRGPSYDIVCIDEAASFPPDIIDHLVDEVISPALMDRKGKLYMASTPSSLQSGRFWTATTRGWPGWASVSWGTADNPYMSEQFSKVLEELKEEYPGVDIRSIPRIAREYYGEWSREEGDYVYCAIPHKTYTPDIPSYILSIDIGWHDATAYVVSASNKHENTFNILESYKQSHMPLEDIAAKIKEYQAKYHNIMIICDTAGAGTLIITNQLASKYNIYITAAEKTQKEHWIETLNMETRLNRVNIDTTNNSALVGEIKNLLWFYKRDGTRVEHPGLDNHLTDAMLYGFRYSYQYFNQPETPTKDPGDQFLDRELKKLEQARNKRRRR